MMPPGTLLQFLVGLVALVLLFFTWWIKSNDSKTKTKDDIDKDIDNANDAHSLLDLFNRLRKR